MYSIAATLEQDRILEAVIAAGFEVDDNELPEPLEHWSLEDFEDLVPGRLS
ncbi:MAG: hypothetical protein PVI91_02145 [Gammaproteobacteria bacterium]|jgi:hypothetical protein